MRQLHTAPAAAAMTFVLCLAGFSFIVFALLPLQGVYAAHTAPITSLSSGTRQIARAVGLVLLLGYASGVVGWVATFALRRDGMHRLASVLNDQRGR